MKIKGHSIERNERGFYEISKKPTEAELEAHYREKYYQNASGSYQTLYSEEELAFFQNQAKLCEETILKSDLKDKKLLDIGCGEGFLCMYFKNQGWTVRCVDFSDFGIRSHNPGVLPFFEQANILTYLDDFNTSVFAPSFVNLDNVLEHVIDPVELLKKVKRVMGPGSIARIEVPNDFSAFQELLLELGCTSETWVNPPEHLNYFNKASLTALLETLGFEIVSLQADYPVEQFLLNEHSNYSGHPDRGKAAHLARVRVTNYLAERNISRLVEYHEAAADLDFGRVLTAYARLAD